MKTALKESIWLAAIIIVSVSTFQLYLGNSAADIGMHDTYIDVNSSDSRQSPVFPAILVFIISLAFLVYMVRVLINRFKYIPANLILILVAGIDIFYFSSNRIVYVTPPTSGSMGIITGGASGSLMPYQLLSVFFTLTLAVTAFMTGRNWKRAQ